MGAEVNAGVLQAFSEQHTGPGAAGAACRGDQPLNSGLPHRGSRPYADVLAFGGLGTQCARTMLAVAAQV